MSENLELLLDLVVLPFYPLWFICFGRFIIHTPLVDMPHRQAEHIFYSVWVLGLIYHAAVCYRDHRIPVILQFFRQLQLWLRDYVLQYVLGTFLWDFLAFIHLPTVCIAANALFEVVFVMLTIFTAGKVFQLTICNEDEKFYLHNMCFLILYSALRVRCKDLYDVEKLVVHFAYACLHLGCLGEHLGYSESYYAINVGMVIFILLVLWFLLNAGSSSDVAGGEVRPSDADAPSHNPPDDAPSPNATPDDETGPGADSPDDDPSGDNPPGDNPPGDNPPGDNPPGDNPPGDNPPDDTGVSPRGPQWKPKPLRKKRKR